MSKTGVFTGYGPRYGLRATVYRLPTTGTWDIVLDMVRPVSLSLDTALRRGGVDVEGDRYASVGVRIVPSWLARVWGSGVEAMALPRVVFVSAATYDRILDGDASTLLIHESAHVDQWRDHGTVRFLTRYVGDYLRGRAVGLPHRPAYRAIRFEREATERAERR